MTAAPATGTCFETGFRRAHSGEIFRQYSKTINTYAPRDRWRIGPCAGRPVARPAARPARTRGHRLTAGPARLPATPARGPKLMVCGEVGLPRWHQAQRSLEKPMYRRCDVLRRWRVVRRHQIGLIWRSRRERETPKTKKNSPPLPPALQSSAGSRATAPDPHPPSSVAAASVSFHVLCPCRRAVAVLSTANGVCDPACAVFCLISPLSAGPRSSGDCVSSNSFSGRP